MRKKERNVEQEGEDVKGMNKEMRQLWAVVVAQLVERSLPTTEVRGLNPVIGKLLYQTLNCLPTVNCIEKTKIKKKRP